MKPINLIVITLLVAVWGVSAEASSSIKEIKIQREGEFHRFITTTIGLTVYTFDRDRNGQPSCYTKCAEKWPPVLLTRPEIQELSQPLGHVARENGLSQLTINGNPVYTFFQDRKEGDLKGDGLGGVWHIVKF